MRSDKEVVLEKDNGGLVETDTGSDVRVKTKDGKSHYFAAPVQAGVNDGILAIRGSNRGERRFLVTEIESVEIEKISGATTAIAGVASGLAILLLFFVAAGGAKGATD